MVLLLLSSETLVVGRFIIHMPPLKVLPLLCRRCWRFSRPHHPRFDWLSVGLRQVYTCACIHTQEYHHYFQTSLFSPGVLPSIEQLIGTWGLSLLPQHQHQCVSITDTGFPDSSGLDWRRWRTEWTTVFDELRRFRMVRWPHEKWSDGFVYTGNWM